MTEQSLDDDLSTNGESPPVSSPGRQWAGPGELLEPRIEGYKMVGLLGQGGMGAVWHAQQLSTKRPVALKLMNPATLGSDRARARFEREVELAAGLDHVNIARVYDSGLGRGVYYYAMALVHGVPFDYRFVKKNHLSQRRIAQLMRTVCQAVQHAHQRGVIHRDLKPSNVLITEEHEPYVLDFGLAKSVYTQKRGVEVSHEGDVPGTIAYMSPEQAVGDEKKVDTRCDVYALGVMLYGLLLEGKHPHDLSGAEFQDRQRIIQEEIRRPRQICPSIDTELEAVLLKALAKEPEDRYGSAGELARDLDNYLRSEPLMARRPTFVYFLRKRIRKYRVAVAITTVIVLGVLAMLVTGYVRERSLRLDAEAARHVAQQQRQIAVREEQSTRQALYFNQIALAGAHVRQGQIVQAVDPLEACAVNLRHWEWFYLRYATDQASRTSRHHPGAYLGSALNRDGTLVAAADYDGIKIWDASTGKPIDVAVTDAQTLAFTHDSKHLASVGRDRSIQLWNLESGELEHTVRGYGKDIRALTFSPDGHYIVTGGKTRSLPQRVQGRSLRKQEGVVCVWDPDSDQPRMVLRPEAAVLAVAYDAPRQRVAAGGWHAINIWNAPTAALLQALPGGGHALAFSPDGQRLASGAADGTIKLWNIHAATLIDTFHGHRRPIGSLAFSPNGQQLVSVSLDGTVKQWLVRRGKQGFHLVDRFLALSPDGQTIAAVGSSRSVDLLDVASGELLAKLSLGQEDLDTVTFSPDSRHIITVSSAVNMVMKLWFVPTGKLVRTFQGNAREAVFSADGKHLAAFVADQIWLWNLSSNRAPMRLQGHDGSVRSVAFSADSAQIACGGDGRTIRVWDTKSGQVLSTYQGQQTNIAKIAYGNASGRVVTFGLDDSIGLWDTTTGLQIAVIQPHPRIHAMTISADGGLMATGGYGVIKVVDVATGRVVNTFHGHEEFVGALAFSADGKRLVSGGDDATVKLWDTDSGAEIITLDGHGSSVLFVSFTPDGAGITSVGDDGLVVHWQAPGAETISIVNLP